jgi:hypothetical protein
MMRDLRRQQAALSLKAFLKECAQRTLYLFQISGPVCLVPWLESAFSCPKAIRRQKPLRLAGRDAQPTPTVHSRILPSPHSVGEFTSHVSRGLVLRYSPVLGRYTWRSLRILRSD